MNLNRYLLSLLVISFAGITNHTFAQDEADASIEEVIVTATKRETNLMETPIAVSVVSQEQLNTQGIARISDLSNLVPNMQVGTSAEDSGVNIAIRGIGLITIQKLEIQLLLFMLMECIHLDLRQL